MSAITAMIFAALLVATVWPDLPFSKAVARLMIKAIRAGKSTGFQARALLAIGAALLLFAVFWALAGDAPMFLAMILPELTTWFATFEIATLAEALLGVGTVLIAARAAGLGNYLKGRIRARRTRQSVAAARKPANDDEPGGWVLAA